MKARNVAVNAAYIDPEFAENPNLMYTQEHIDVVYNPVHDDDPVVHVVYHGDGSGGWIVLWVLLGILVVVLIVCLIFIKNWKEYQMPTLWEMLTKKKEKAISQDEVFYNPLKLRIGNHIKVNNLDLGKLSFSLTNMRVVERNIDGQSFRFADYDLTARPLDGEPVHQRIRVTPHDDRTFGVLLLKHFTGFGYDEGYHKGLAFENNKGEAYEPEWDGRYWRVNDVQTEWNAKTDTLTDANSDGFISKSEVKHGKLTYWDFWRETNIEGLKVLEFYIVEMNGEDGWFDIWVGQEIDPNRVEVI